MGVVNSNLNNKAGYHNSSLKKYLNHYPEQGYLQQEAPQVPSWLSRQQTWGSQQEGGEAEREREREQEAAREWQREKTEHQRQEVDNTAHAAIPDAMVVAGPGHIERSMREFVIVRLKYLRMKIKWMGSAAQGSRK